jgi:NAD(P)-dependent dehydrogenase (short-subunit alcohol dehydrogenase family)
MSGDQEPDPPRVCLFTGASGLLGTDFCRRYANRYEIVGVWSSNKPQVEGTKLTSKKREKREIWTVRADLREEGAPEDLVRRVTERFGSVDLLVNAAVFREFGSIESESFLETLDWQFWMNVAVPVRLAAALTRSNWSLDPSANRLRNRNVVNLSSTAGRILYKHRGQSGYAATKAALDTFTLHLASELADHGIRVNGVAPNTFPHFVPTEAVSRCIVDLDSGTETGRIVVMAASDGETIPSQPT